MALEAVPAGLGLDQDKVGQQALQHRHGNRHHLAADAVAGDHAQTQAHVRASCTLPASSRPLRISAPPTQWW